MKALLLPFAWIWITIPLGWGVYQSVNKSASLFNMKPAAATATPAAPGSAPAPAAPAGK